MPHREVSILYRSVIRYRQITVFIKQLLRNSAVYTILYNEQQKVDVFVLFCFAEHIVLSCGLIPSSVFVVPVK